MRKNVYILLLIYLVISSSCSIGLKKLHIRKIKTCYYEIDWYTYSAAWANVYPDYLTIKKDGVLDTLAELYNLVDVKVNTNLNFKGEDTIVLCLYGKPAFNRDNDSIKSHYKSMIIVKDTTYDKKMGPTAQCYFTEDD